MSVLPHDIVPMLWEGPFGANEHPSKKTCRELAMLNRHLKEAGTRRCDVVKSKYIALLPT